MRHSCFIPFDSNQVKLAGAVTYDDQGNEDIRYSVRDVDGKKVVWISEKIAK